MESTHRYALGHSEREIKRLSTQARVFEPFTLRMLQQAGLSPGMRVLDVGSGTGDVAFLCASIVGPAGEVLGMDRAPAAVETARNRAAEAGFQNVAFQIGDAAEVLPHRPFDAIVGRLVLMHQPDPVALLTNLSRRLRPAGIIAFQEFDISGAHSYPSLPTFEKGLEWISAAFTAAGTDTRLGVKLHRIFVEAGFPVPSMSLDAGIWAGAGNPGAQLLADVVRSLLPALEKFGIATAAQVEIETFQQRIQEELKDSAGVCISPSLIGAWSRLP